MFQKLANSEGVGLQIEKILDDFTWNDPILRGGGIVLMTQNFGPRIKLDG